MNNPNTYIPLSLSHLSLRDYFASVALQGILAGEWEKAFIQDYADFAYRLADLMLETRQHASEKIKDTLDGN